LTVSRDEGAQGALRAASPAIDYAFYGDFAWGGKDA
jgi:hypothetical protein